MSNLEILIFHSIAILIFLVFINFIYLIFTFKLIKLIFKSLIISYWFCSNNNNDNHKDIKNSQETWEKTPQDLNPEQWAKYLKYLENQFRLKDIRDNKNKKKD